MIVNNLDVNLTIIDQRPGLSLCKKNYETFEKYLTSDVLIIQIIDMNLMYF